MTLLNFCEIFVKRIDRMALKEYFYIYMHIYTCMYMYIHL